MYASIQYVPTKAMLADELTKYKASGSMLVNATRKLTAHRVWMLEAVPTLSENLKLQLTQETLQFVEHEILMTDLKWALQKREQRRPKRINKKTREMASLIAKMREEISENEARFEQFWTVISSGYLGNLTAAQRQKFETFNKRKLKLERDGKLDREVERRILAGESIYQPFVEEGEVVVDYDGETRRSGDVENFTRSGGVEERGEEPVPTLEGSSEDEVEVETQENEEHTYEKKSVIEPKQDESVTSSTDLVSKSEFMEGLGDTESMASVEIPEDGEEVMFRPDLWKEKSENSSQTPVYGTVTVRRVLKGEPKRKASEAEITSSREDGEERVPRKRTQLKRFQSGF